MISIYYKKNKHNQKKKITKLFFKEIRKLD